MPDCENCGATVSEAYVRVFSRGGRDVRACPRCPDKVRQNGRVRDAKSSRENARAVHSVPGESGDRSDSSA